LRGTRVERGERAREREEFEIIRYERLNEMQKLW
jgi:hypothetical protein